MTMLHSDKESLSLGWLIKSFLLVILGTLLTAWFFVGCGQRDLKKKNHWKTCMGTILVLFVFSASFALGAEVLLVVGKKDLRAGVLSIKNYLENRGFNVIIREVTIVKDEDASGKDLVILSESARSREAGTKFRDVAVPVICSEPWLFSKLGMTGQTKKVDFGRKSHQKKFIIINPDHPLCASCSKEVQVCSKSFFMGWGVPGENAIAIDGLSKDPHKCTIFAYDTGVEMPGLVAPAKRVGLFLFRNTANAFTPEGWSLFDSALDGSISPTETVLKTEMKTKDVKKQESIRSLETESNLRVQNEKDLNQECDYFSASRIDNIAWIELKGNMLQQSTDLKCREALIDYLNLVSEDTAVKIVVLLNSNESTGYEKYAEFYQMVGDRKIGENDVWRMLRTFDSLINKIWASPKFLISATKGKLYPQIFSMSLACDFRIVAENTTIQNVYLDFGLAPKGGGAYFLQKQLGRCKAFELLLSEEEISAKDALELGVVNKAVPLHALEISTLEMAREFAKKPSNSIMLIKRLLNSSKENLADYLEFENQEIMHSLAFLTLNNRFSQDME